MQIAEDLVAAVASPARLCPAPFTSATRMCHGFVFLCDVWKMLLDDAKSGLLFLLARPAQEHDPLRICPRRRVFKADKSSALITTRNAVLLASFSFTWSGRIRHYVVAPLSFSSSRVAACSSERARSRFSWAKPGICLSSYALALARSLRARERRWSIACRMPRARSRFMRFTSWPFPRALLMSNLPPFLEAVENVVWCIGVE